MTIDPSQFEPGTTAWMEAVLAAPTPEQPDPRDAEIARLRAEVEAAYREGFRDGLAEAQSDGPWIGENAHWLASHANT